MNSPFAGLTQQQYDAQHYRPEKRRDAFLRKKHGISLDEYTALWEQQGGRCAICDEHENTAMTTHAKLVVDHDHHIGKVRGLLCDLCNKGLGQFKDNSSRINSALSYLEAHNGRMDRRLALVVGNVRGH